MSAVTGCGIVDLAVSIYHATHLWGSVIIELIRYKNK
jgi:hypothetical protein